MNDMHCSSTKQAFSGYLDGAISGREMQAVAEHLDVCSNCAADFAALRAMQSLLAQMGPAKAPADLNLQLRLAVSRESLRQQSLRNWAVTRWENFVRPMIFQVSAGLASALVLVGGISLLLGIVAAPPAVQANDEPLGAITAPHFLYSAAPSTEINSSSDSPIVVEAKVNERGQVYDYQVVSGSLDSSTRTQLMSQLLADVFEPARVFGTPVRGQVVVTFAGVSVRG